AEGAQGTLMRSAPSNPGWAGEALAQEQRLHLLIGTQPRGQYILAGARKITQRLVPLIRHNYRHEIAGTRFACQQQRIAPIGFDALLNRTTGNARRGHHLAAVPLRIQTTRQSVAARAGFIDHQGTARAADTTQSSAQGGQARYHGPDKPRCLPSRFRYRNCDGVFVNVQSDEGSDSLFHGSVSRFGLQSDAVGRSACGKAHSSAQPTIRETDLSTNFVTDLTRLSESGHDV